MKLVKEDRHTDISARLPRADWLRSHKMTVSRNNKDFAPPALTNQWAFIVSGRDVLSYAGLAAPPIYNDGIQAAISLEVDGTYQAGTDMTEPLSYTWYPGRIERDCTWQGLDVKTRTAVSCRSDAVLSHLTLSNLGAKARQVNVSIQFLADLRTNWVGTPESTVSYDGDSGTLYIVEQTSGACAAIGGDKCPTSFEGPDANRHVVMWYHFDLAPGGTWSLKLVHALSMSLGETRAALRDHQQNFETRFEDTQNEWEKEWQAAFTPNSGRFSGHLPMLETGNTKLARLYYMSIMTLIYCKRTRRFGTPGMVYATGMPSSSMTFAVTSSFLWDAMMVSGCLSMLDPDILRYQMEDWLWADIHKGYGIDFLSGEPLGFWYAVNDYALIHMAYQYLRYSGDYAWLDKKIRGETVFEHLVESADYWKHIADEDGLADYGEKENLLECVSTYTHKVASFNAANVWNARTVAEFAELVGNADVASRLRQQADALAEAVNSLYVEGAGYFHCKQPDGSMVPVRHCLDFFTVMQCMREDLPEQQRKEMIDFFLRELKTTTWMHALSPQDPDAAFSSRTDHQDEGAYTTWPAYCLEVLLQEGYLQEALDWVGADGKVGLADVTRQGPFGQAYYHGDGESPRVCGAAAKAPMEWPHIEKPVLISGGKYAQVIIEAFIGVNPQLGGDILLTDQDLPFDLRLVNLHLRKENYDVKGVV